MLGPSEDGGYYLIGMKKAHPEPFERIAWSTASVLDDTLERCRESGLEVAMLPAWYDVDDAATLDVLRAELLDGLAPAFATMKGYEAPRTREFLATMMAVQTT